MGAKSPDDPTPVPSPYIPSNFSYTQLGNKRISDIRQPPPPPPPKIISPYEPTKLEDHTNKTHNLVGLIEVTQCGLCGESFARSSSLARHVAAAHPFPCHTCDATFQTKAALKRHAAVCAKGIAEAIISSCIDNMGIS